MYSARPRRGQSLVDYLLVLGLIAVLTVAMLATLGGGVSGLFGGTETAFAGGVAGGGEGSPSLLASGTFDTDCTYTDFVTMNPETFGGSLGTMDGRSYCYLAAWTLGAADPIDGFEAGQTYTFELAARSGAGDVPISVMWLDAGGVQVAMQPIASWNATWSTQSADFTVPARSAEAVLPRRRRCARRQLRGQRRRAS